MRTAHGGLGPRFGSPTAPDGFDQRGQAQSLPLRDTASLANACRASDHDFTYPSGSLVAGWAGLAVN